jgi:hypothetical protein
MRPISLEKTSLSQKWDVKGHCAFDRAGATSMNKVINQLGHLGG